MRTSHQHLLWPQGLPFTETALRVRKRQAPHIPRSLSAGHVPTESPPPHTHTRTAPLCRHGAPFHEWTEAWAGCWGSCAVCGGARSILSEQLRPAHTQSFCSCLWNVGSSTKMDLYLETHPDFYPYVTCVGSLYQFTPHLRGLEDRFQKKEVGKPKPKLPRGWSSCVAHHSSVCLQPHSKRGAFPSPALPGSRRPPIYTSPS